LPHLFQLERRETPAVINFTLMTAASSLTLGGNIDGNAIQAQGAGSLTTTYSGVVQLDVDDTANTLQALKSGTAVTAMVNGSWQPLPGGAAGTAPANYGGKAVIPVLPPLVFITANFALRDIAGTLESAPIALSGTGATRTFPSDNALFTITAGSADYNAGALGTGTETLVGSGGKNASTTPGSITDNGDGTYSVTVPIDVTSNTTVNGLPTVFTIKGTINATAVLPFVDLNGPSAGADSAFVARADAMPVSIAPAAVLTRQPAADLSGMTVRLVNPPDAGAESLAVDLTGTGLSSTGYDPVTGSLIISGAGSLATYQSALRKVAYSHASGPFTAGPRTVEVTVSDAGNTSQPRTANGVIPTRVTGVAVNGGVAQRSRVNELKLSFDARVNLPANPADAFALQRQSDNAVVTLAAAVDNAGPGTAVTLTFTGGSVDNTSLADGRYTLTAFAVQVAGGALDGDGDGNPGDDFVLTGTPANGLFRLFGDNDGDGDVDAQDFGAFRAAFGGTGNLAFDFDGDGDVDAQDFGQFRARFGTGV